MTIFEKLNLLERLHNLIKMKATGTPEQLGQKIGYSKRQVTRLIRDLKVMGMPIRYDRDRKTYYYDEDVTFKVHILIDTNEEKSIKGGKRITFFTSTPKNGVGREYLCN